MRTEVMTTESDNNVVMLSGHVRTRACKDEDDNYDEDDTVMQGQHHHHCCVAIVMLSDTQG